MSWEMETVEYPKARKDYSCDAAEWIGNTVGFNEREFEPEDWEKIEAAMNKNFKILKGEKYLKVSGKYDGEFSTFRAIPALDEICKKYDIYED